MQEKQIFICNNIRILTCFEEDVKAVLLKA